MNRTIAAHFDYINIAMQDYRIKLAETIQRYNESKRKAEESVSKYQEAYKKEALAAAMKKPTETAKAEVLKAGKELKAEMKLHAGKLREELQKHLCAPMDANFVAQLKLYRELDIAPTGFEAEALLKMNNGNSLGVRALSKLLEQTGASKRLTYRSLDEYGKDLEQVERVIASLENPVFDVGDVHTALELFGNEQWIHSRPDGSTYTTGENLNFLLVNGASASFSSLQKSLEKMKGNWQADISYQLQDAIDAAMTEEEWKSEVKAAEREGREPQPLEQPTSTTQVEGDGTALAREIGQATAKAARGGAGAFIKQYAK